MSSYNKESLRALLRELTAEEDTPAAAASDTVTPTRKQPNPLFKVNHVNLIFTFGWLTANIDKIVNILFMMAND